MNLTVGQKVAYPGQGVCLVAEKKKRFFGERPIIGYVLKVLGDNSIIFVPEANADSVGIRPLITTSQCKRLISRLAEDFENISSDWKVRSKDFVQKLQSGDVFAAADVLKQLTYLSHEKRLSFREQTLLEKAKFLIVSEITNAADRDLAIAEVDVLKRVNKACSKHLISHPPLAATANYAGRA